MEPRRREIRGWRTFAAVVLLAAGPIPAALAAQSPDAESRESPEVTELSFTGVHHVDENQLASSIVTHATRCKSIVLTPLCLFSKSPIFAEKHYLDRTELQRDVLRIKVFYWRHGYRDAQVDTSVARHDDGVAVAFRVAEGPPTIVRELLVTQAESVLTTEDVRQAMLVRAGGPLDLIALDSSQVLLRNRLWDLGYADAVVDDSTVVAADRRSGIVRVRIDPGRLATIDSIAVLGNQQVTDRTVRNMLVLRQGHLFRRTDVAESQRNLYSSGLFNHAVIATPETQDSAKRIIVSVAEAPFHEMRVSGGFNTVDFLQLEGRFTDYSWLGGARRLALDVVVSNILAPKLNGSGIFQNVTGNLTDRDAAPYLRLNYEASAEVTQPWFHDPRNTLGASLFAHRRSAPAIFIDRGYGASASFTRMVAPRSPLSLVYRYELTEVDAGNIYFCVNYGVCETQTIGALRGRHALSPLSLAIFTNRANDPFSPTSGYTARLDLEHASAITGSEFRYNRISGEATRYQPVGRSVLAGRIRFGWVKSLRSTGSALGQFGGDTSGAILHPRKRFYAGGSQSVRGYGENQLGPRVLTVDPAVLMNDSLSNCSAASIADRTCDPSRVPSDRFEPRPTGGTSLIEANLEYRFPITKLITGAVFVDGAFLGEGALSEITKGTGAITPGFGVRYQSPVGPIRVDLGIRPTITERLRVITETTGPDGTPRLVELRTEKHYSPLEGSGQSFFREVLNRLALHLSIGQAF